MGALDVRLTRDSRATAPVSAESDLARLLEAADRIENEEYVGEDLAIYFASLGSAGGARPKVSMVSFRDGDLRFFDQDTRWTV